MTTRRGSTYEDAQTDRLVGEAMFHANVMLALARSSKPQALLADTTLFIESFDYYAGMQYLRTTRVVCFNKENDPMTTVFQALGYAYGSLPQPQAYALVCSLLQYSQLGHRIQNRDRLAPFTQRLEMPSHFSDPMSEATPQSDAYNEEALPKYTSALFERGQEDGKKLERTVSTLSLDPPQFRVIIRFGALHGSGIGRSKKIARHLAAKALCHRLRITI